MKDYYYWGFMPKFLDTAEGRNDFLKLDMGENMFSLPEGILDNLGGLKVNYYPGFSEKFMELLAARDLVLKENIFP